MLSLKVIQELGRECGLAQIGVSPITVEEKYLQVLDDYLQNGFYGEMQYLQRWREYNRAIKSHLPWANTVLVAIDNYYSAEILPLGYPAFSRYAWGSDYHVIIKDKLQRLFFRLQQQEPNLKGKIYVDTGPILAKALAEQAGLGWIGNNCLFIAEGIGSFVFIGLLYLDREVEMNSQPIENRCNACRLCLQACPTGALLAPGRLNARRCLAYLTIEKRSSFTPEEQLMVQGHLYGCDRCQEVCPYNRMWAQPAQDARYREILPELYRSETDWRHLTATDFKRIFRHSVVRRLGFVRFQRNLAAQK